MPLCWYIWVQVLLLSRWITLVQVTSEIWHSNLKKLQFITIMYLIRPLDLHYRTKQINHTGSRTKFLLAITFKTRGLLANVGNPQHNVINQLLMDKLDNIYMFESLCWGPDFHVYSEIWNQNVCFPKETSTIVHLTCYTFMKL